MSQRAALSPTELQAQLAGPLNGWQVVEGALQREWTFADFRQAFAFLTYLALLSEAHDHHAELWNVYNRVRVRLNTHEPPGISQLDVRMAEALTAYRA